ncbi:MAG: hypothetical protein ACRDOL_34595, partial [Streptosporangiaceae bacterium]
MVWVPSAPGWRPKPQYIATPKANPPADDRPGPAGLGRAGTRSRLTGIMAGMADRLRLAGEAGPVVIVRDDYGIPHV